jgi:hypothetical protein
MISGAGRFALSSMASSFQPEDVEVHIVALCPVFVGETLKTLALLAVVAALLVLAVDDVIQVAALKGVFLERKKQVRAEVICGWKGLLNRDFRRVALAALCYVASSPV